MMNNKDAIGRSVEKASLTPSKSKSYCITLKIEQELGKEFPNFKEKVCKVTLYQDGHVDDKFISGTIPLTDDIFTAISNARHLIYIVGWSVYAKMTMIRDLKRLKHGDLTLGELLKKKANEGVRVLILV
ncbi:hypothetical protein GOBAR_DD33645 [Gossypium barbadense]|nr:hypothetical protein GOBAR_DD33645 [Gossypium barbadense]